MAFQAHARFESRPVDYEVLWAALRHRVLELQSDAEAHLRTCTPAELLTYQGRAAAFEELLAEMTIAREVASGMPSST